MKFYFLDHLAFEYSYLYDFSMLMEMITVITRTEDLHMQITPMTTLIQIILKMKFFRLINWWFSNDLHSKQHIIWLTPTFLSKKILIQKFIVRQYTIYSIKIFQVKQNLNRWMLSVKIEKKEITFPISNIFHRHEILLF